MLPGVLGLMGTRKPKPPTLEEALARLDDAVADHDTAIYLATVCPECFLRYSRNGVCGCEKPIRTLPCQSAPVSCREALREGEYLGDHSPSCQTDRLRRSGAYIPDQGHSNGEPPCDRRSAPAPVMRRTDRRVMVGQRFVVARQAASAVTGTTTRGGGDSGSH